MGKIVRLNPVPIRVSAFGIGRVRDDVLVPGVELVPFIRNIADSEMEKASGGAPANDAAPRPLNIKGKRAGLGLPGGGMETEEWEDPPAAVRREYEREYGLKVKTATQAFPEIRKIIVTDNETGQLHVTYYEKGQQPSVSIDISKLPDGRPRQEAVDNHWYGFHAQLAAWEGTTHQRLFRQYKCRLIESGDLTEEEVAQEGMSLWWELDLRKWHQLHPDLSPNRSNMTFPELQSLLVSGDLTAEELWSLGIEELGEVDGLLLFPVEFLRYKLSTYPRNPLDSAFYKSHLRAVVRALPEEASA